METPSIGTKALLKGSWWDDDAQTDEERADRERYWVVEVVPAKCDSGRASGQCATKGQKV